MSVRKSLKKALKYFIAPLLLLCVVIILSLLSYRAYLQHKVKEESRISAPNGIESMEKVTLGGVEQWILIRGWDKSNPVLLHLHGGPGAADISMARFFDRELEKHFVMVHWDQRGAGKSYSPKIPKDSMTIGQLVEDTRELTERLRKRFNTPKIYLVGHSWGSELGTFTVSRYPELYYAYVGIGQVVHNSEAEEISYQFALDMAKESGHQEAMRELQEIGAPPYNHHDKILVQRKWLEHFGGVSHIKIAFNDLIKMGLTSPDYSLLDGVGFFRGQVFSPDCLWEETMKTNLFESVPRIEVPVYFFTGRYDYNTPFELAERYYRQLEAPRGKQLIWFENSGHMIPYEEPEKYSDMLINKVLKETYESPP